VNIAAPLIIQVFGEYNSPTLECDELIVSEVGLITISVMNSTQTLMIDLVPGQGSSITACVSNAWLL
jgi:hypothetical protein